MGARRRFLDGAAAFARVELHSCPARTSLFAANLHVLESRRLVGQQAPHAGNRVVPTHDTALERVFVGLPAIEEFAVEQHQGVDKGGSA